MRPRPPSPNGGAAAPRPAEPPAAAAADAAAGPSSPAPTASDGGGPGAPLPAAPSAAPSAAGGLAPPGPAPVAPADGAPSARRHRASIAGPEQHGARAGLPAGRPTPARNALVDALALAHRSPSIPTFDPRTMLVAAKLGHGGFGDVYLAQVNIDIEGTIEPRLCAVKVLAKAPPTASPAEAKRRVQALRRERQIGELCLRSPWVAPLLATAQTARHVLFCYEFMPGGTLQGLLDKFGALDEDRARVYFAQMLAAVTTLHDLHIAHADLKTANFMVDADGCLRLIDFGLSHDRLATRAAATGGSPPYMPPERVVRIVSETAAAAAAAQAPQGAGGAAPPPPHPNAGDAWALGVLLCEMLAGLTPFDADTREEVYALILAPNMRDQVVAFMDRANASASGQAAAEQVFSADAQVLILGLLDPNPAKRMTVADATVHPFLQGLLAANTLPDAPQRARVRFVPVPGAADHPEDPAHYAYFDDAVPATPGTAYNFVGPPLPPAKQGVYRGI